MIGRKNELRVLRECAAADRSRLVVVYGRRRVGKTFLIRNKVATFQEDNPTARNCHVTMVTTYGVKPNKHSGIVQSEVTLDDLFRL